MAKDAFFKSGERPRSVAGIRLDSDGTPQTLPKSIPDGDTTGVYVEGRMLVRFLGIDTPEKRIDLPGPNTDADKLLNSQAWEQYLSDPFRPELGTFELGADLSLNPWTVGLC